MVKKRGGKSSRGVEKFIEKEAREKLGLGKPGEVVVILPKVEQRPSNAPATEGKANWRKWWELYVAR